jgi:hypothetical protein
MTGNACSRTPDRAPYRWSGTRPRTAHALAVNERAPLWREPGPPKERRALDVCLGTVGPVCSNQATVVGEGITVSGNDIPRDCEGRR